VSSWDILLQQIINGVSLGAIYSLLALGFTIVYGIIELINFAHFNVFMVGSFIALWMMQALGFVGQAEVLYGLPLVGVLLLVLFVPRTVPTSLQPIGSFGFT
jgi:branched-chain amino acid transport system permease protein